MTGGDEVYGGFDWHAAERDLSGGIDYSVPHSARVWNYLLGYKDYGPVDQLAGDQFAGIYGRIRFAAAACRAFTARVVKHLAGDVGIRQFVDIGVGLPTEDPTHEIAQSVDPGCRVLYIDSDPLVIAYANAVLCGDESKSTFALEADLTASDFLQRVGRVIDFRKPVAFLAMNVLRHLPTHRGTGRDVRLALRSNLGVHGEDGGEDPGGAVVGRLIEALPVGGYLALCDLTSTNKALAEAVRLYNAAGPAPWYLRTPQQIACLLQGLEILSPGVVPVDQWRVEDVLTQLIDPTAPSADAFGALALKCPLTHSAYASSTSRTRSSIDGGVVP